MSSHPDSESDATVLRLYQDRQGTIWIGCFGGLYRYDREQDRTIDCYVDPHFLVKAFYEDRRGNLWLGTGYDGLVKFDRGSNTFVSYQNNRPATGKENNVSANNVISICEDEAENFWLGTYGGGLYRFNPSSGAFTLFTEKDGLPSNVVYGLLIDAAGKLWMSSNNGIASFDPRAKQFRKYGIDDGLQSTEFNYGAYFKGASGRYYFGGINGFNMFLPSEIKDNDYLPPVFITNMKINGENRALAALSSPLSYAENSLAFSFAALNYTQPEKNQYSYWLEGADKDWRNLGTERNIRFASLAPGNYLLHVRGSNNDGIWSNQEASFRFSIKTPYWQTPLAYAFYILMLLAIGFGAQRYRVIRLHRNNLLLAENVRARTIELDEKIGELKLANAEKELKNSALAEINSLLNSKNSELADKNRELQESQKQTEAVFSALSETLPGAILNDKYRLEHKIGAGGFGVVYRAVQLPLNRAVAIKILQPLTGISYENFDRFHLEAISTCRVNHPNTIAVLDFGITANGIAYMVMELLEGHTLKDELAQQKIFSELRCLEVLLPICECLATAHQNGIIHRDIKPENIFLHQGEQGEVIKLLDFGIAKLVTRSATLNLHNVSLTRTGDFLGTPTYMSPERLSNKPYDGRADVYSLGILLYRMLCGQLPFESLDGDIMSIAILQMTQAPQAPHALRPDLSPKLEALLLQTLAKDPQERPTAAALAQELTELLSINGNGSDGLQPAENIHLS